MSVTLPTRTPPQTAGAALSRPLTYALALHVLVFLILALWAWLSHRNSHWGAADPTAGSIQVSAVSSLPLPPKQRFLDKAVLTSEKPSIAPKQPPPTPVKSPATPTPTRSSPAPKPDEIPIPAKTATRPAPSLADRLEAEVRKHPPTPAPPTPKATTGETAGIQIPQSITQLKNGTASLTVDERSFGDRYAWYIRLISQKINQSKSEGEPDTPDTRGKHATIRFTIQRDGTPTDISIATRSGSPSLDQSTLRAIQRIDTFGPLPAGNQITIRFEYDSH